MHTLRSCKRVILVIIPSWEISAVAVLPPLLELRLGCSAREDGDAEGGGGQERADRGEGGRVQGGILGVHHLHHGVVGACTTSSQAAMGLSMHHASHSSRQQFTQAVTNTAATWLTYPTRRSRRGARCSQQPEASGLLGVMESSWLLRQCCRSRAPVQW